MLLGIVRCSHQLVLHKLCCLCSAGLCLLLSHSPLPVTLPGAWQSPDLLWEAAVWKWGIPADISALSYILLLLEQ